MYVLSCYRRGAFQKGNDSYSLIVICGQVESHINVAILLAL